MTKTNDQRRDLDEPQTRAEAAAWLARLQSEDRTTADEAGFRAWLAQGPAQREAFDRITSAWELAGGLTPGLATPAPRRRAMLAAPAALAACAAAAVIGVAVWPPAHPGETYATKPGQTLRVPVADGSTVLLDGDSRLHVRLTRERRSLSLEQGRAHFEVAHDPGRPFVVAAGQREVLSIGTVFDVQRHADGISVVLIEGKVAVRPVGHGAAGRLMRPGDRLIYAGANVRSDRPDLIKLTAWQQGQAIFDDDTLAAAVAELNRYSQRPIVIGDQAAAALRVSGSFRAGATEEFATALASLLPIDVHVERSRIVVRTRAAAGASQG